MQSQKGKPEIIKNILNPIFTRIGLGWRVKEQRIIDKWKELVGQDIALNAQPLRFRGGILYIKVRNAIWMQQLQFLKKVILDKIHREIKEITLDDIRFFIGEIQFSEHIYAQTARGNDEQKSIEKRPGNNWTIPQEVAEEIEHIKDPEIRQLLFALYAKQKGNLEERPFDLKLEK